METRTTKRLLGAGLLAATLLLAPVGLSGAAHASTIGNPVEEPVRAIIAPGSTGNAELDNLCRQAADLINNATAEEAKALHEGRYDEAAAWSAHAADMQRRAEGWGCQFVTARRVPPGGPRQVPITQSAPQHVAPAGSKPLPITNTAP